MQGRAIKSNTSERIRDLVNDALDRHGMSGRQASLAIVGHDGLIRDIRAGRLPSIDKLEALFELLGLEFYFGEQRGASGPSTTTDEFAKIPLYNVRLSAGQGFDNSIEYIEGEVAFQKTWMQRLRVSRENAIMARVYGESMLPTIRPGDMALIDRSKKNEQFLAVGKLKRRKPFIFAFVEDGEARVKRIQRLDEDTLAIISDNTDFPPRLISEKQYHDMSMIGRVMWWGHTDDGT